MQISIMYELYKQRLLYQIKIFEIYILDLNQKKKIM
jgi:hypothetical protein